LRSLKKNRGKEVRYFTIFGEGIIRKREGGEKESRESSKGNLVVPRPRVKRQESITGILLDARRSIEGGEKGKRKGGEKTYSGCSKRSEKTRL